MMRRRNFITLLGGAAAWPLSAHAQQPAMPVVGFLSSESPDEFADRARSFHQGLGETGYVEGQNVTIEYRWAGGEYDRLPALAADLVRRHVSVIATSSPIASALAAKAATATIPIVFATGADPIKFGLIASFNRPGGNLTGVSWFANALVPKLLEVLRALVPQANTLAVLVNPSNPNAEFDTRDAQAAARTLGVQLVVQYASSEGDLNPAFASFAQQGVGAFLLVPDTFLISRSEQLVAMTQRYRVPGLSDVRRFTMAGGLMSYGASEANQYRQAGVYVGRILKGEKPADLPVMQPTKFELVINLKAAKALGLAVPGSLLARADEVIE
jgi:putative ABC transport system substrate-binding protein